MKKGGNMNNVEEIKRYIREIAELHLEEEAYLVRELGGFGVGSGFELGQIPHPIHAKKRQEYKQIYLADSIRRFWTDAGVCYVKRRFRACVILLACVVEAAISLELLRRNIQYNPRWTLGQLIKYCKKGRYGKYVLPEEAKSFFAGIIDTLERVNELRIEAVHMKSEKERPQEMGKWDDLIPIEVFKAPPVKIDRSGVSGDDVTLYIPINVNGKQKVYLRYPYKKMAMKAYNHVQSILKHFYNMKFKFSFNI